MKTIQEKLFNSFFSFKETIAIEYKERKISYEALDKHSNRIAHFILEQYGEGAHIGVLLEDRLDFIITMLGIFKARCVFIPLEPTFPVIRLTKMINFVDSNLVICDDKTIQHFKDENNSQRFRTFKDIDNTFSSERPPIEYFENDTIYIYHTSGTTSAPKAVVGRNISLLHFILWEIQHLPLIFRCGAVN